MQTANSKDDKSYISRIPWKKYFVSILKKLVIVFFIAILFLLIIYYSSLINPNIDLKNPSNVIGFKTTQSIMLIILSVLLFIFVLGSFLKTLFIDHQEEFGIDKFRSKKSVILAFLVISFISSVYILLDIALKNIYLTTGPVDAIWIIDNTLGIDIPTIDGSTDRLAYAKIRTYFFFFFYIIMFVFPVIMFFMLLTRFGRKKLFKSKGNQEKEDSRSSKLDDKAFNALGILFAPILMLFLISILFNPETSGFTGNMLSLAILSVLVWWVYQIIMLFIKGVKLGVFLSYANIILFFPLIFLFYLLPVILWTGWDILKIYAMNGSTVETIHNEVATPLSNTVIDIANLSMDGLLNIIIQTLAINAISIFRIFQLDFVFVVGISALAIGFAEGYAIISIFTAFYKGASIARTGKIARKSAPKMIVMASRLVMLGAWLTFFYDRVVITVSVIKAEFSVVFPWILDIELPRFFDFFYKFSFIIDFGILILPLTPFVIALYYILMSSFKFLSVSLIVEKVNDPQVFYLLISSAFVLITTNILQDITESVLVNTPTEGIFLPTNFASAQVLIAFANKLFETIESVAFYAGVLYAGIIFAKMISKKVLKIERKQKKSKYDDFFASRLGAEK